MVYTLTGNNSYLAREYLNKLKTEFVKKYGESNIESYTADQLTSELIINILGGVSLFSTNRMVIIKDLAEAKEAIDKLLGGIKSTSDTVEIVIVEPNLDKRTSLYKTLKKYTEFHEFSDLSDKDIIAWIQTKFKQLGADITPVLVRELYECCGPDQLRLSNEIQKIATYNKEVTKESISLLVEPSPRDTIFELLDLTMSGQTKNAINKLKSLESSNHDPFQIASMLIWQTHNLAVIQTAREVSDSELAKKFKLNPYVVTKTRKLASKISREKLKNIVDKVADLDITLKTNSHDPWRAIEQTIFAL